MITYTCSRCVDGPNTCTIILTGSNCLPVACPFVPKDRPMFRQAYWERTAGIAEAAKTNLQQLKQAIAQVRESITTIEQQACI
jgi:hypothetical protein